MDFVPWKKNGENTVSFATDGRLPQFFCDILASRGFGSAEAAQAFLGDAPVLHDPLLMKGMEAALPRIRKALATGERILVYGDYDCDGVTATVMLYDYLENAGADVLYYIPQRQEEGYGLNCEAVRRIHAEGVNLMITVDNGISAAAEIAMATGYGIDVIVTDHHHPPAVLPVCTAIINPHQADCGYPFKGLCGAGVAFKLISALEDDTEGLLLDLYGDLLAIATMADIVPLVGENRFLAKAGLAIMANTQRPGIVALAQVAGVELESITGEQISFAIAPRINVTGRIDSVDLAVELLLTQDEAEAQQLANTINDLNTKRKEIEAVIVADIGALVTAQPDLVADRVLVIAGEGWHPGVIGITAARLVERYRKPCIILAQMESGELRGSARSVEGFSIIDAIAACGDQLYKFGGHPMAAGLSLAAEKLPALRAALAQYSAINYPEMPCLTQSVDSDISPADITLQNIALLDGMQPFGCGNPQPVPVLRGVTLAGITPVGGGNHLRLSLTKGGSRVEVMCFSTTPDSFPIPIGTAVDCAVALSVNTYQGSSKPSARLVGITPVGFPMASKLQGQALFDCLRRGEPIADTLREQCLFGRADLAAVFKLLRELSPYGGGADWLINRLGGQFGGFRLLVGLEILAELGLIAAVRQKNGMLYTVVPTQSKADMAAAATYQKMAAMNLVRGQ